MQQNSEISVMLEQPILLSMVTLFSEQIISSRMGITGSAGEITILVFRLLCIYFDKNNVPGRLIVLVLHITKSGK